MTTRNTGREPPWTQHSYEFEAASRRIEPASPEEIERARLAENPADGPNMPSWPSLSRTETKSAV